MVSRHGTVIRARDTGPKVGKGHLGSWWQQRPLCSSRMAGHRVSYMAGTLVSLVISSYYVCHSAQSVSKVWSRLLYMSFCSANAKGVAHVILPTQPFPLHVVTGSTGAPLTCPGTLTSFVSFICIFDNSWSVFFFPNLSICMFWKGTVLIFLSFAFGGERSKLWKCCFKK